MSDKSASEILSESLERSAEEVRKWPQWMREAASTAHIFRVAPVHTKPEPKSETERDDR